MHKYFNHSLKHGTRIFWRERPARCTSKRSWNLIIFGGNLSRTARSTQRWSEKNRRSAVLTCKFLRFEWYVHQHSCCFVPCRLHLGRDFSLDHIWTTLLILCITRSCRKILLLTLFFVCYASTCIILFFIRLTQQWLALRVKLLNNGEWSS